MKEIIEDLKRENFTRREVIIYGVIAPIVFTLLTAIV